MVGLLAVVSLTLLPSVFCHVHTDETAENHSQLSEDSEEWNLRFFPKPNVSMKDQHKMFHDRMDLFSIPAECDDGLRLITNDFDGSPKEYTCSEEITTYDLPAIIHEDIIPPFYESPNVCINYPIAYSTRLPTYGPHRPIGAKYGEYKFLPRERWLHNAEHGAVIMLYHPCANATQVDLLRNIVTGCLKRYIITTYKLLPPERPVALLTWGWYLSMAHVNQKLVKQFIKDHALQGYEPTPVDGKFYHLLVKPASIVTNVDNSVLCS